MRDLIRTELQTSSINCYFVRGQAQWAKKRKSPDVTGHSVPVKFPPKQQNIDIPLRRFWNRDNEVRLKV